jgi:hypothetical protein
MCRTSRRAGKEEKGRGQPCCRSLWVFQGMRSEGSAPVLRCSGQRSGTWRQSAQACSQKHKVPGTYIRNAPRHTHARRAIRWPSEFLVAWCFMHVPKQRDNRSIRGQSRVQGHDASWTCKYSAGTALPRIALQHCTRAHDGRRRMWTKQIIR